MARASRSAGYCCVRCTGGLQRIRRYGVLANGCKKTRLAQARAALQQPAPNRLASESAAAVMARVAQSQIQTCPKCRGPRQVMQILPGLRRLPVPGADITAVHTQAQVRAPP